MGTLRDLDKAKENAIMFFSHATRNPLNSVVCSVENLRMRFPAGSEHCEHLADIERGCFFVERNMALVLDYVRISSRKHTVCRTHHALCCAHGAASNLYIATKCIRTHQTHANTHTHTHTHTHKHTTHTLFGRDAAL